MASEVIDLTRERPVITLPVGRHVIDIIDDELSDDIFGENGLFPISSASSLPFPPPPPLPASLPPPPLIDIIDDDELSDDIFGENGLFPISSASSLPFPPPPPLPASLPPPPLTASSTTATTEVHVFVICIGEVTKHLAMELQCGHIFHCECILMWMERAPGYSKCPICRSII